MTSTIAYHAVLTLESQEAGRITASRTLQVPAGTPRSTVYATAVRQVEQQLADQLGHQVRTTTLFWSLEREDLS
ncbi:hypothetical protein [Streptomyces sp. NPDC001054]